MGSNHEKNRGNKSRDTLPFMLMADVLVLTVVKEDNIHCRAKKGQMSSLYLFGLADLNCTTSRLYIHSYLTFASKKGQMSSLYLVWQT